MYKNFQGGLEVMIVPAWVGFLMLVVLTFLLWGFVAVYEKFQKLVSDKQPYIRWWLLSVVLGLLFVCGVVALLIVSFWRQPMFIG